VGGAWPYRRANRQAANVIANQILLQLVDMNQFELGFMYIGWREETVPALGQQDLEELKSKGVAFERPLILGTSKWGMRSRAGALLRVVALGEWHALALGAQYRTAAEDRIRAYAPDLVATVWSEVAQNLVGPICVPKVAYAGNPDHKVFEANWDLRRRLSPSDALTKAKAAIIGRVVRASHLSVMRGFDRVLDVAANDAAEYREAGVRADYIQNMWPTNVFAEWESFRDRAEVTSPVRIVGNVGQLSATGNTFGLLTLVEEIMPRLKAKLGDGRFEVHLFGTGEPRPEIRHLLQDPHIRLRGFVEDLDSEILSAPIFLVANNHDRFKVGHTRFLHAWSLGSCCIAFEDSRMAMPEIRHGENALLAKDADGIVDEIARAALSRELRRRLGRTGVETLLHAFSPARVVRRLADEISHVLDPVGPVQ
jgi:glycosyltransferase involved in cell wall biosynthesis